MTDIETVGAIAVTNVTFDGRRYRPGAAFELPAPCAHALAASGAVRLVEPPAAPQPQPEPAEEPPAEEPADDTQPKDAEQRGERAAEPPAAPAAPSPARDTHDEGAGGESSARTPPPAPIALEEIPGIGPSTAARLRKAGVADVAALAALSDERAAQLRVRAAWRERARALAPA